GAGARGRGEADAPEFPRLSPPGLPCWCRRSGARRWRGARARDDDDRNISGQKRTRRSAPPCQHNDGHARSAMSNRLSDSNVYYFPSTTPAVPVPTAVEPVRFMRRLRNAWWRLRLALSEIRTILRRPTRRLTLDDYV